MDPYREFREHLLRNFTENLKSYKESQEIYRSLCNTVWEGDGVQVSYSWRAAAALVADLRNSLDLEIADPDICEVCHKREDEHIKKETTFSPFWSKEEITLTDLLCQEETQGSADDKSRFVAGYDGPEDYIDFYCSGGEGEVPIWIKNKMKESGYTPSEIQMRLPQ